MNNLYTKYLFALPIIIGLYFLIINLGVHSLYHTLFQNSFCQEGYIYRDTNCNIIIKNIIDHKDFYSVIIILIINFIYLVKHNFNLSAFYKLNLQIFYLFSTYILYSLCIEYLLYTKCGSVMGGLGFDSKVCYGGYGFIEDNTNLIFIFLYIIFLYFLNKRKQKRT